MIPVVGVGVVDVGGGGDMFFGDLNDILVKVKVS